MKKASIKIFGIGGAGCNVLNFMARESAGDILAAEKASHIPESCEIDCASADRMSAALSLIALNTDEQSLASCVAPVKFCLGAKTTHGLGTGGDPDLGHSIAESDLEQLREFCEGATIVFIIVGLGGGTGTGACSLVAQAAKDAGARVLGIVVTPFDFEGGRRHRQAQLGLQQLKAVADAVICLPNEKVFKMIDENKTLQQTFNAANQLLAQGVFGISRLLTQTGLINVNFADICAVTRNLHAESSFAISEAAGENRAQQVVGKLFTHPMLEEGKLLEESESLLVSLVGGADLTMAEVNHVMKEISEHCEHAHVIFGAAINDAFTNRLSVTLVASGKIQREEKNFSTSKAGNRTTVSTEAGIESDAQLLDSSASARPRSRMVAPAPELTQEKKEQLLTRQSGARQRKAGARMKQNELPLEIISKGRFEKSEPTIHRGEDLDLPTYIRRGIALN